MRTALPNVLPPVLPNAFAATVACGLLLCLNASCSTAPGADGAQGSAEAAPRTLDPERVTRLEFYGGRCAGEPSADGVDGVTGVELEAGKTFVAELYFAGGTGYSWTARGYDESVVRITEQRSRPIRGTDAVGAKQLRTMNFTAQKPGRTRITFELKRPWETTEAPVEVRHTTIYVK